MIFNRPRAALALFAALFTLAFPAGASAAYVVDSTADEPDAAPGAPCTTAGGKCTLRAAIEAANEEEVEDNILFDGSLFNGQLADTIALGSALPAIQAPVTINAGTCAPPPTPKPCAGVSGPSGGFGISVEANGVTISGLAITGALTGINVINASREFTARGNWIGIKLDGSAGANNTGVFLDPGSDDATIGGSEVVQRNVIAGNNNEGLDIEGASEAIVRGNYFGVAPDGTTQMANAKNIEITDSTSGGGFEAELNEIGEGVTGAALTTMACDGGCNVISGAAGSGIDLDGGFGGNEAPASGPTTVRGNYVGLNAGGTAAVSNGIFAIFAGAADAVVVGGFADGEMNRITGSGYGIYGEDGDYLDVIGNVIGLDAGAGLASPPSVGIFAHSEALSEPDAAPFIAANTVVGSGIGIEQRFQGGMILDNFISGGNVGILTRGVSGPPGNLIAENRISDVADNGILIENDENGVFGNEITDAGENGILLVEEADQNRIGGDEPYEENTISGSDSDAIEISTREGTENEVARNVGSGNAGLFIDLEAAEAGELLGPNGGIQPPQLGAKQTKAQGVAEPGAVVRVFRKASPEAGELQSFLGEAVADGSGNWEVAYPEVPAATLITATQSLDGGTSELAEPVPTAGDSVIVCSPPFGAERCGEPPKPRVTPQGPTPAAVPDTKIVKGPKKKSAKTTAKFRFSSTVAGSSFECKLDRKAFKKCKSPQAYKKLKPGKHVFQVRAVGPTGQKDPTPAKRKFTVLG